jgi:hypothetical protein
MTWYSDMAMTVRADNAVRFLESLASVENEPGYPVPESVTLHENGDVTVIWRCVNHLGSTPAWDAVQRFMDDTDDDAYSFITIDESNTAGGYEPKFSVVGLIETVSHEEVEE